jgi:hypothetical protein
MNQVLIGNIFFYSGEKQQTLRAFVAALMKSQQQQQQQQEKGKKHEHEFTFSAFFRSACIEIMSEFVGSTKRKTFSKLIH